MASVNLAASSCLITPSIPTPRHTMFLSAVDIIWRWFPYVERLLFYKLDPSLPYHAVLSLLKSSLSLALVPFYPFAGRLFEQENGRLALDCNDAGVQFWEASVDVQFSTLEEDAFQYQAFFGQLVPLRDIRRWDHPDLPLLSVQVTRFPKDAGIAVGVAQSHAVADGHSFWHFMKAWGECARGLPISMSPLHMRMELGPEKLILPAPQDGIRSVTAGGRFDLGPEGNFSLRVFHFSGDTIQRLKEKASEDWREAPLCTSYEALSAHVWKHVTAARAVADETRVGFFVAANFRSRLRPALPPAFFGNVIARKLLTLAAGQLRSESLSTTAKRIREMVRSMDDEYFRRTWGEVEVGDPNLIASGTETGMEILGVASSPKFAVYEVEFGWGRPLCVRYAVIDESGVMVLFPGAEGDGSVDVSLSLPHTCMERLMEDECFISFP